MTSNEIMHIILVSKTWPRRNLWFFINKKQAPKNSSWRELEHGCIGCTIASHTLTS